MEEEKNERKYWTQIPNIVDELQLSPYAYRLYGAIKRTVGQNGECWKTTTTLAEICGMSVGMVSKAKEELERPFELLNGKPLIRISKTMKHPQTGKTKAGGHPYHVITVVDIWPENMNRFSSSPHELEKQVQVHHMNLKDFSSSPHEHRNNPINNEEEHSKREESKIPPSAGADAPATSSQPNQTSKNPIPEAIKAYHAVFERYPRKETWSDIDDLAGMNLERWQDVCRAWKLQQNNPLNLRGLFDWFRDGIPDHARTRPRGNEKYIGGQYADFIEH